MVETGEIWAIKGAGEAMAAKGRGEDASTDDRVWEIYKSPSDPTSRGSVRGPETESLWVRVVPERVAEQLRVALIDVRDELALGFTADGNRVRRVIDDALAGGRVNEGGDDGSD